MIHAQVVGRDAGYHLALLDFNGQRLQVADTGLPQGAAVRVRILARDVALSRALPENTSILNIFPVIITKLSDHSPAQVLVGLDAAGIPLLARITRKSWDGLGLALGQHVYAQVKSVALLQ